jgi:hypothetical protein
VIDQNRDAQKIEAATASQNVPAVSLYLKTGFTGAEDSDQVRLLSFKHFFPFRLVRNNFRFPLRIKMLIHFVIDQNRDAQKIEAATASQNVPAVSLYLKTFPKA